MCSCGFSVFIGGGEFRGLLGHPLGPELPKVVSSYISKKDIEMIVLATCNGTLTLMA